MIQDMIFHIQQHTEKGKKMIQFYDVPNIIYSKKLFRPIIDIRIDEKNVSIQCNNVSHDIEVYILVETIQKALHTSANNNIISNNIQKKHYYYFMKNYKIIKLLKLLKTILRLKLRQMNSRTRHPCYKV